MATFKENLKQTFANFKTKYIGNVPEGVTVAQINQHLTDLQKHTIGTPHELTSQERQGYTAPSDGYIRAQVSSSNAEANYGTVSLDNEPVITIRAVGTQRQSVFVRKGTTIKAGGEGSTLVQHYYFIPLV